MAKVLVVDDEESIRYTFNSFLSDEGYSVTTARNYDEALTKISGESYDLIFMDIILGGKTGINLLKEIREQNSHCPVVMITGFPSVETASDAVRLGAFDYIFKPVRQETLIHTASKAIRYKKLYDENEKYRSNLEAIFGSVNDAIITVGTDMTVLEVNKAAGTICGIGKDQTGMSIDEVKTKCDEKCFGIIKKTIRSRESIDGQRIECGLADGRRQVVSISTAPLLNKNNDFYGVVLVIRDETRLNNLERSLGEREKFHNIVGHNWKMQKIYSLIEDLSDVQTTVLITGESGTGKELVADAIHYKGNRHGRPIVKVNCSALSESLLESELFGHVKGAFTGADKDRIGRFQMAGGGTIFLDEIGDISPRMQLRLLRVIQEKEIERVGESVPLKVDVRIIAATNQDLTQKVKTGEFREDLYYRLKVVELALPPLRERKDDIPLLTDFFLEKFNNRFNKNITAVSDDVHKIFKDYSWPGNIRELEHTIEHAFVTTRQNIITVDQLPGYLVKHSTAEMPSQDPPRKDDRQALIDALKKAGWNKSKAARILGINVRTIYRNIKKYNITPEEE